MSGCRSKLKPVVCVLCLTILVCASLWLPSQHEGCGVAQSCDQCSVEEPGAKHLLYIFFIMCFYTDHYRCNKEVSVIGIIKSLSKNNQ